MNEGKTKVLITRKRWDAFMLPLLVLSIPVGIFFAWQSGQLRFAAAPLQILFFWGVFRILTPKAGMEVPTIRSTPGAVEMLWLIVFALLLAVTLNVIDTYLLGHSFGEPLELYHLVFYAPPFIVLIGGAVWCDRKRKNTKSD